MTLLQFDTKRPTTVHWGDPGYDTYQKALKAYDQTWKAKRSKKPGGERIEIRKAIACANILIIVSKGKDAIEFSTNGTVTLRPEDMAEIKQAVNEARQALGNEPAERS